MLLPTEIEEMNIIREWLNTRRGGQKVELHIPRTGPQQELVQMAAENASATLTALQAQWQADTHRQEQALAELQAALGLAEAPNRIECYDISNTQGTAAVGSMVVFEQGVPKKASTAASTSARSAGRTILPAWKRCSPAVSAAGRPPRMPPRRPAKSPTPPLPCCPTCCWWMAARASSAAPQAVLERFELTGQVLPGQPGQAERGIVHPRSPQSLLLPRHSQALYLVQRVRDEAHRYAITSHRQRRDKAGIASQLDAIPGIGPMRRKALLTHFGGMQEIRQASTEELLTIPGITIKLAEAIRATLG